MKACLAIVLAVVSMSFAQSVSYLPSFDMQVIQTTDSVLIHDELPASSMPTVTPFRYDNSGRIKTVGRTLYIWDKSLSHVDTIRDSVNGVDTVFLDSNGSMYPFEVLKNGVRIFKQNRGVSVSTSMPFITSYFYRPEGMLGVSLIPTSVDEFGQVRVMTYSIFGDLDSITPNHVTLQHREYSDDTTYISKVGSKIRRVLKYRLQKNGYVYIDSSGLTMSIDTVMFSDKPGSPVIFRSHCVKTCIPLRPWVTSELVHTNWIYSWNKTSVATRQFVPAKTAVRNASTSVSLNGKVMTHPVKRMRQILVKF